MELVFWDYLWPQLWKYVKEFVKSCDVCVWAKNLRHHLHGFLQPLLILASPWSSISMNFIIDLPPSNSYDSILVVVDHLMKMTHFISCTKTITSEGTSKFFLMIFLVSWSSWRYHFRSLALVCIQVLEATLWAFKWEGEVVISFPPPNEWANIRSQSSFGVVFTVHN
jgi:hypothetical protein